MRIINLYQKKKIEKPLSTRVSSCSKTIYIYIYIYMCVCVCVCMYIKKKKDSPFSTRLLCDSKIHSLINGNFILK